jgi:hypothetical protein
MAQTVTIQQVVDWARSSPSVVPVLGAGGLSNQPALGIAQSTISEILAQPFAWKWNRGFVPAFTCNVYQQDYATNITNAAWLEKADFTDLNQSGNAPDPIVPMSAVKELSPTTQRGTPTQICALLNAEAQCGVWSANTQYVSNGSAKVMPAAQAIPQIRDSNGNVQIITTPGTSGASEPVWSTTIGGATADGSAVWTMLDPLAMTLRINALPVPSSNVMQFRVTYQINPPVYAALTALIGIPDVLAYVWRELFLAYCLRHAGDPRWIAQDQRAHALIAQALGAADREPDAYQMVPATSLMVF